MRTGTTLAGVGLLLTAAAALPAQETGSLQANFSATPAAARNRPVMVSVIQNGAVVVQSEVVVPVARSFSSLPYGTYDVRVEGDGLVTQVKRGVQITGRTRLELEFTLRPGDGVHIVEYATGGLSREEVAARLQHLDSAVTALQRAMTGRATGRPN